MSKVESDFRKVMSCHVMLSFLAKPMKTILDLKSSSDLVLAKVSTC